ncbi:hypothetical protein AXF42_Ash019808 [Apostasia shenzhenica]|uniref:Uncharacterized protein n=1 Tax=Apostasia shenzhenica TaxID=1088818 RepID=A0A2I0ARD1_9ASPA|nr:hypothetical protein AXF42_Ash019808 [Apostasia shenzhenica]
MEWDCGLLEDGDLCPLDHLVRRRGGPVEQDSSDSGFVSGDRSPETKGRSKTASGDSVLGRWSSRREPQESRR